MPGARLLYQRSTRKCFAYERCDRIAVEGVVLAAARADLHRAQQRREPAALLPVPALRHAVEQSRAVRVAAARRIDELRGRHRGRRGSSRRRCGCASPRAPSVTTSASTRRAIASSVKPGALGEKLRLVVVHRHGRRAVDHLDQLVAAEQAACPGRDRRCRGCRPRGTERHAAACRRGRPARRCRGRRRARRPRSARASGPSRPDGTR